MIDLDYQNDNTNIHNNNSANNNNLNIDSILDTNLNESLLNNNNSNNERYNNNINTKNNNLSIIEKGTLLVKEKYILTNIIDSEQNTKSNGVSFLQKLLKFKNEKNTKIGEVLVSFFLLILMSFSVSFITYYYSLNHYVEKNSFSVFLSFILGMFLITTPSYIDGLFIKCPSSSYSVIFLFSLCQAANFTLVNIRYNNKPLLCLFIVCLLFIYLFFKLKYYKFHVGDYLKDLLYFNLIIGFFFCLLLSVYLSFIYLLFVMVFLTYMIIHFHVYYCLTYYSYENAEITNNTGKGINEDNNNEENKVERGFKKIVNLLTKKKTFYKNKVSMAKRLFRIYTDIWKVVIISIKIILENNHHN